MNVSKQSVQLVIFVVSLGVLGLYYHGKIPSAHNLAFVSRNVANNSVISSKKDANDTHDSITQPIHLQINLSRHKVTLYRGKTQLKTYPIAVGRQGWETPTGNFQILEMLENPTWIHPLTGKAIPGGSHQNPLGHYWIGFWTNGHNWIGFHGTPNPDSVGKALSHGCIRMYNKDIEELFHQVSVGTPVTVVQ